MMANFEWIPQDVKPLAEEFAIEESEFEDMTTESILLDDNSKQQWELLFKAAPSAQLNAMQTFRRDQKGAHFPFTWVVPSAFQALVGGASKWVRWRDFDYQRVGVGYWTIRVVLESVN